MGLGKLQAFLMGVFGGAVSGQGATTGQALVKQANGSWAPGTVGSTAINGDPNVTLTGDGNLVGQFQGAVDIYSDNSYVKFRANEGTLIFTMDGTDITLTGSTISTIGTLNIAGNATMVNAGTGYFNVAGSYLGFAERGDPSAPSSNNGLLYARDNGAGKTQLCVRFPTGAVQVLATEP